MGIVVLWYGGSDKLDLLIRHVDMSEYSHVGIMANGCMYEALGSGIVKHEGEDAKARAAQAIAWREVPASPEDAAHVCAFMDANVGHGYSVAGFLAAGLDRLTRHGVVVALDGQYICSGFVATAVELTGVLFDRDPRLMTPEEIAEELGSVTVGAYANG